MQEFVQQLVNGIAVGSTYAVVALGFGLVFSVMRVLNLTHPDFLMVAAYATYMVAVYVIAHFVGMPAVLAVALTIAAGVIVASALGLLVQTAVIQPLQRRDVMMPFLATAGVSIAIENAVQAVYGSDPVAIPIVAPNIRYQVAGVSFTSLQLLVLIASVAILVVVSFYVRRTKLGLATRAIAERPAIAATCGVNVRAVSQVTMIVAAATAGLGGVTVGLLFSSATPTLGLTFGVKSFVVMLVAGNKNIEAIMLMGILLGILEALVSGYVSSTYRDAFTYGILIAILLWRPNGIFGSYSTHS
jgi:branched-chain amino acid transport system permease protein